MIMVQTQLALGYLGVAFIRSAQVRKNLLLTVDRKHETPSSARHFARHAMGFMAFVAIPYMLERTLMENVGHYNFAIFANKVESSLRIHNLFPTQDAHRLCLLSAVASSNLTVGTYADQTFSCFEYRIFPQTLIGYLDNFYLLFIVSYYTHSRLNTSLKAFAKSFCRFNSCLNVMLFKDRDLVSKVIVFLIVSQCVTPIPSNAGGSIPLLPQPLKSSNGKCFPCRSLRIFPESSSVNRCWFLSCCRQTLAWILHEPK